MNKSLADKIKKIRNLKNLTQIYMSDSLGITQSAYSKIEKGLSHINYEKLEKIAQILQLNITDIVEFDPDGYLNDADQKYQISKGQYDSDELVKLYQDKVLLLERLLENADLELERYKQKYGAI